MTQQLQHIRVDWAGVALQIGLPELVLKGIGRVVLVYPALRWLAEKWAPSA